MARINPQLNIDPVSPIFTGDITASNGAFISTGAIGNNVLAVTGVSGQTGDLQQWRSALTGTLSKMGAQGNLVLGGTSTLGMLSVYSDGTTRIGQVIRGTAGQTADLQQWQTSTPTTVARVDSGGNFKANNVATLNSIAQMAESNSGALFVMGRATAQAASPGLNYGTLYFRDGTTAGTLRLATRTGASGIEETIVDNLSSTGSTAGARFTGAGGVSTSGAIIINNTSASSSLLSITGTGGGVMSVSQTGAISTNAGLTVNGGTSALGGFHSSSSTPVLVVGASGQTADLQIWRTLSATTLGGVNGVGQIYTGSTTPILTASGGTIQSIAAGANPLVTMASAHNFTTGDLVTLAGTTGGTYNGTFVVASTPASTTFTITSALTTGQAASGGTASDPAQLSITAKSAGTIGAIIRGAASQTAALFEVQSSTPSTLLSVGADGTLTHNAFMQNFNNMLTSGRMTIGLSSLASGVQLGVYSTSATNVGTIIRGAAGQSANLLELQDPASNVLSSITSAGNLNTGQVRSGTTSGLAQITGIAGSASTIGAIIRGAVSQSADLLQLQNSGGTTLSYFDSTGTPVAPAYAHTAGAFRLLQTSSGGVLQLTKATSAVSNVGADVGRIYFRDGTTAGTLKLIARTGASGVEETIVDNISSTGSTAGAKFVGAGGVTTSGGVSLTGSNSPITLAVGANGTTGQVLASAGTANTPVWRDGPVDATTSTAATGFGYMGLPQNATTTGSYTIVAGDAGEHIYASATRTVTIPANSSVAFPIGTTITFIAGSGATMTIAITSDTMYLAGPGTTGSRTLAPFGMATAVKITSTSWIISGNGLT